MYSTYFEYYMYSKFHPAFWKFDCSVKKFRTGTVKKFTLLSRNSRQVEVLETLVSRKKTTVSRNVKKYMSGNSTENASVGAAVLSRVVLEFRVKLHEMNRVAEF